MIGAWLVLLAASGVGAAQENFPSRPVRIVIPYSAGTPEPIVERVSEALETALAISDVRQKLDIAGCQPMSAPLSQFADIIKSDVALWAKVVKDAGITAD
jgi:tripartite-type tricarboxylate transporter receptor subunit TctC